VPPPKAYQNPKYSIITELTQENDESILLGAEASFMSKRMMSGGLD